MTHTETLEFVERVLADLPSTQIPGTKTRTVWELIRAMLVEIEKRPDSPVVPSMETNIRDAGPSAWGGRNAGLRRSESSTETTTNNPEHN